MKNAVVIATLSFLCVEALYPMPTSAHEWYPKECCSARDCVQADQMLMDERGDRIVLIGGRRIWVSKYLSPRPSPDTRVHICFREVNGELDGALFPMTICLFTPAES